jgi:uncharacterized FlaG/YvyC family protein
METGLNVRPVQTTSIAAVRVEPAEQRQVARTELPEAAAVTAAPEVQPVRFDEGDDQGKLRAELNRALDAAAAQPTLKVEQDETTREIVFRKVSPSTGQVVQQFPDEAVMRQRAYAAQQRRAALEQALLVSPGAAEEHVYKVA